MLPAFSDVQLNSLELTNTRNMQGPRFFNDFRLEKQFYRRQQNFKPNLNVQADVEQYRVDAVISGAYVPPDEDNEIVMECFDLNAWHGLLEGPECP